MTGQISKSGSQRKHINNLGTHLLVGGLFLLLAANAQDSVEQQMDFVFYESFQGSTDSEGIPAK